MFNLVKNKSSLNILCLGAHPDDIEIGCGGVILRIIEEYKNVHFFWVIFSAEEDRKIEANNSAKNFLKKAKSKKLNIEDFRENYFPFIGTSIRDYFTQLKNLYTPDIIFTHYHNDAHQDHRLISNFTWNTFRNHLILEYEIPKYDGDLGSPNLFFPLIESICQKKIKHILKNFNTQKIKHWFTEDTFFSLLRLRGIESNSPSKYAEAFYCRKIIF